MTSIVKKFAVLLLVASITALAGCATPGGGLGGNGDVVNDLLTERAVIRAIYEEPDLTDDPILVGCVDGVITLTGTVDSELDKELAARVTRSIAGVTQVNNNLITRS